MKVDRSKDSDEVKPQTRGQQVKRAVAKAKSDRQDRAPRKEFYKPQPREARR